MISHFYHHHPILFLLGFACSFGLLMFVGGAVALGWFLVREMIKRL